MPMGIRSKRSKGCSNVNTALSFPWLTESTSDSSGCFYGAFLQRGIAGLRLFLQRCQPELSPCFLASACTDGWSMALRPLRLPVGTAEEPPFGAEDQE